MKFLLIVFGLFIALCGVVVSCGPQKAYCPNGPNGECGDNAAGALGIGLEVGQTLISLGTSGVVAAVSETPTTDASGLVAGFADATGAGARPTVADRRVRARSRGVGARHEPSRARGAVLLPRRA